MGGRRPARHAMLEFLTSLHWGAVLQIVI
ncbi:TerC family protein, partial [Pseudomonas sp. MWU13-2860]